MYCISILIGYSIVLFKMNEFLAVVYEKCMYSACIRTEYEKFDEIFGLL